MLDVTVYRIDEAVEQGTQAVARAQSLGLNALASRALGDIGYSLYIKRQPERARQFLEQSVQLAERSKDFDAAAANRIRWADALFTGPPRRPLAAIQVMEPAVQWYRRSRREDLLASSLAKWGGLLLNRPDRFAEAEQILLEALARAKKEHDDIAQVMALQRLAGTYSDRNLPKGIAYWNQALPLIRSTNILGAFAQMARSYAYFGDFATANQLLVEHDQRVARQPELYARKNAAALGATTRAQISYLSGVCSASLPEFDLPAEAAEVAALVAECLPVSPPRAVFERHRETTIRFATAAEHESDTYRAGRLWTAAALVSLRLGDYVAAEQYAHSAIGHFEQSGRKVQEIHPMLVLRRSLLRQKKLVEAEAATARALGLAREVGFSEPYDRFNGRKDLERLWAR